ncbi:MAG TPA: phage tail sheath family protein [Bacteroidetes bacterium]|nr:phage tail sheath family protein [Bacteroidota bacterium]
MNTPGVYIKETLTQPTAVAGAATSVPVFIGFTELAAAAPVRISGMLDFHTHFGQAYSASFTVVLNASDQVQTVVPDYRFYLYDSVRLHFQNGGGPCYILSAGTFSSISNAQNEIAATFGQLDTLEEATLVLIPDLHAEYKNASNQLASLVNGAGYASLGSTLLNKLGVLKNKFAIFDLHSVSGNPNTDAISFRASLTPTTIDDLKYGAAYYPWLRQQTIPSVSFAQLTLSKNFAGDPLVDNLSQILADVQTIESQFGFVPTLANCKAQYETLKATFLAASTGKKGKFTAIFKYLYNLVAHLDSLNGVANSVSSELAALKTDDAVSMNIRHLYRFKGILAAHTAPDLVGTTGFSSPADAGWYNAGNSNQTSAGQVESEATLLSAYQQLVNGSGNAYTNWAAAAQVLQDLESGTYVHLNLLFAGVARIWNAVQHKRGMAEQQLMDGHPVYAAAQAASEEYLRKVPAQGAISGAYGTNDRKAGVWRSPANLSLQGIYGPLFALTNADQDGLNVDPVNGKSINAIRTFTGRGTLIWGGRTLAGASAEWRFISVRRFFSFAESSIRKAAEVFLFAPNHSRTWVQVKAMITSFLVEQWKQGALVGNTWEDAFQVQIGPGNTPGEMDISVGLAVARPAEFIIVNFSQTMQNA